MKDWKMRREEVTKLIAAYRKLKCLWDYRCREYKIYDLKKRAWVKLGKMFGKEPNVVKKKIKCLRSAYGSEKRKVYNSYGSSHIYRPNLFYYKDLNFLDEIIGRRKGTKIEHNSDLNSIAECNEELSDHTESTFIEEYEHVIETVSPPSSSLPPPQKMANSEIQIGEQHQHRLAPYYSKLDAAVNSLAEVTKSSEDNLYTTFGKIVAMQLSQLPSLDATVTMSEIHQILSKNIIKSLVSKNGQSCKTNRKTEFADSRLSEDSKHESNEFEEDSVSY